MNSKTIRVYGRLRACTKADPKFAQYESIDKYVWYTEQRCIDTGHIPRSGDWILSIEFLSDRENVQLFSHGALIGHWNRVRKIEFPDPFLFDTMLFRLKYDGQSRGDTAVIGWLLNKGGLPPVKDYETPHLIQIPDDVGRAAMASYGGLDPCRNPKDFPKSPTCADCIDIRSLPLDKTLTYLKEWIYSDYSFHFNHPKKVNEAGFLVKCGDFIKAIIADKITLTKGGTLVGSWETKVEFPEALPFSDDLELDADDATIEWLLINTKDATIYK